MNIHEAKTEKLADEILQSRCIQLAFDIVVII